VQSGDLGNEDAAPLPPSILPGNPKNATIQSKARDRLKVLTNTLDSINRYASNEPPEVVTEIIFAVNEDDIRLGEWGRNNHPVVLGRPSGMALS
jgi:hypothetical protein